MSGPEVREKSDRTQEAKDSPQPPPKGTASTAREEKRGRGARMAERLEERREAHLRRNKAHRIAVVVLGFVITLAGLVMTGPVPGPGFLIIPLGLALLALEFQWAERLLERALAWTDAASRKANEQSTARKVAAAAVFVLAVGGFVTAAILWDIPVLPV